MSNVKNYAEQGGEKWVVNGILEVTADGQIKIDGTPLTRATAKADSTAADIVALKDDFNDLLTKLKSAGLMAEI
ncbi:Head fiber protein [Clostridium tyrobutyricum]|uniref:Head fiber protein n=1 Tax=Clostridium tyrobutyricum TaxID=1519 RepID=UPI001C387E25|nr:Head fiber protein [Clostridium tyrobutyricum]MBV4424293.1 Head fiber protein [Clostridium tyrobutyricum]